MQFYDSMTYMGVPGGMLYFYENESKQNKISVYLDGGLTTETSNPVQLTNLGTLPYSLFFATECYASLLNPLGAIIKEWTTESIPVGSSYVNRTGDIMTGTLNIDLPDFSEVGLSTNGKVSAGGGFETDRDIVARQDLTVGRNANISGDTNIDGKLTVKAQSVLEGALTVSGATVINSSLTANDAFVNSLNARTGTQVNINSPLNLGNNQSIIIGTNILRKMSGYTDVEINGNLNITRNSSDGNAGLQCDNFQANNSAVVKGRLYAEGGINTTAIYSDWSSIGGYVLVRNYTQTILIFGNLYNLYRQNRGYLGYYASNPGDGYEKLPGSWQCLGGRGLWNSSDSFDNIYLFKRAE